MAEAQFKIEVATHQDLREITDLVNSAYRGDSSRKGWTTEADFLEGQRTDPETLRASIERPSTKILTMRNTENSLVGCVYLQKKEEKNPVECYLGMLTVNPTIQDQGLGKKLLEASEAYAKKWGAQKMSLRVIHLREPLMQWYERRGYQRLNLTEPFPYNDAKAGIPLRNDLHFIIFEKTLP